MWELAPRPLPSSLTSFHHCPHPVIYPWVHMLIFNRSNGRLPRSRAKYQYLFPISQPTWARLTNMPPHCTLKLTYLWPPPPVSNLPLRPPRHQVALLEGPDPLDWLFRADQYVVFYQIPLEQCLSMVASHMKDDALSWFKLMHQSNLLIDWVPFTSSLCFGPSSYTNH